MIDFSKVTTLQVPYFGRAMGVVKIKSGEDLLWIHGDDNSVSLEVKKITTTNDPAYGKESFIRLGLYTGGNNLPVKVTYGGLTKEVDFNGSINATVFFGSYKGVSDEVETPESGTLTIEGGVGAVVAMVPCITGINNWGLINRIEYKGFQGCKELNISYIPEGITMIGDYAFQNCTDITDIRIPSTVEKIRSYAFDGCTNLSTVTMEATTPPTLGNVRVFPTHENFQIIVPAGCGEVYKAASGWSTYANIIREADEN